MEERKGVHPYIQNGFSAGPIGDGTILPFRQANWTWPPHPEDRLHLRLHRARSVVLTAQELVEIRAAQRTFEGAYMRTALSQFSFALIILKIFTSEFYAIGALFAVYGVTVMVCAAYRRYEGNRQFFSTTANDGKISSKFRTCNNSVLLLTVLSLGAYIGLLILTWNLAT